jgi:hypothetical protein
VKSTTQVKFTESFSEEFENVFAGLVKGKNVVSENSAA